MNDPESYDTDGERAMWAAVLRQTIRDASCVVRIRHWRKDRGQSATTHAEQADARDFLADPQRFAPICEAAGIDPDWLAKMAEKERKIWQSA